MPGLPDHWDVIEKADDKHPFRLATSRRPASDEIKVLLDVFQRELADFRKDKAAAEKLRTSVVAPAQRSASAQQKVHNKRSKDDLPVHSFQTLLSDLATIVANRIQPKDASTPAFDIVTTPTVLQQRALDLLGIPLKPPSA